MKYIILTIAVEREGDYYVSSCMELGTARPCFHKSFDYWSVMACRRSCRLARVKFQRNGWAVWS